MCYVYDNFGHKSQNCRLKGQSKRNTPHNIRSTYNKTWTKGGREIVSYQQEYAYSQRWVRKVPESDID